MDASASLPGPRKRATDERGDGDDKWSKAERSAPRLRVGRGLPSSVTARPASAASESYRLVHTADGPMAVHGYNRVRFLINCARSGVKKFSWDCSINFFGDKLTLGFLGVEYYSTCTSYY